MNRAEAEQIYAAAQQVVDVIFRNVGHGSRRTQGLPYVEDRRHNTPNPYYRQTTRGLILDLSGGLPTTILTPWGKWELIGSAAFRAPQRDVLMEAIRRDVTLAPFCEVGSKDAFGKPFGPAYAIMAVGGSDF